MGKVSRLKQKIMAPENIYIQQIILNDKAYPKSFITHADILNGGKNEKLSWGINRIINLEQKGMPDLNRFFLNKK